MTRSRPLRDACLHTARLALPKPKAQEVDMTGRRVVVTGASVGSIGYTVAKVLAGWGADVVATCRHGADELWQALRPEEAHAAGPNVRVRELDLADPASVAGFADWYRDTTAGLDVLVNNAGILLDVFSRWRAPMRTADGIEIHWRTNFLGTVQLTAALLPLLMDSGRLTGDARVVNVVSHQHAKGRNAWFFAEPPRYDSWTAYGQSKLGLVHHSFELNRRYANQYGLRSVAVHPGSAHTNMIRNGIYGLPGPAWAHRLIAKLSSRVLMTPEQCAQTIILCASTPDLQGGRYYERCAIEEPSDEALDADVAGRVWAQGEQWVSRQGG